MSLLSLEFLVLDLLWQKNAFRNCQHLSLIRGKFSSVDLFLSVLCFLSHWLAFTLKKNMVSSYLVAEFFVSF